MFRNWIAACLALKIVIMAAPAFGACDVRKPGNTPVTRYSIDRGVVYDQRTRLTWQRCSVGQTWRGDMGCDGATEALTWSEATQTGKDGWRIPTRVELASLIAKTCANPAINDTAFPGMELDNLEYWTSTQDKTGHVWYINFADGAARSYRGESFRKAVRLVRSDRPGQ